MSRLSRRLGVGAEVQPDASTHFRVWAPRPTDVRLVIERGADTVEMAMTREESGYRSVAVSDVGAGTRYRYRLDDRLFADPASRFQPEGPFGPSQVVDPDAYAWQDSSWRGITIEGQVLYEMHLGTFTPEGTWRAAAAHLPDLKAVGITSVEIMPVADFPGRFGWGYDGVFPYAPSRLYGTPDDFRFFVDRAHQVGLGVILDVVYNHLGPSGCVHREFATQYFTTAYDNEWGDAINFDGPDAAPVREYFSQSAAHWIHEYRLDGLRLDAIHGIHDRSPEHIVAAVSKQAREVAGPRSIIIVVEDEKQNALALQPTSEGGYGVDAGWNDDFHHSAYVALTGRREAYFSDHNGTPQEFISAAKYGYLFQGQRYAWQKQPRGTRTDGLRPAAFVNCIENHDQVANTGDGSRVHQYSSPGQYRAIVALLLLMPGTPMLFQGQEFGASNPFLYFADHTGELAEAVRKGRNEFMRQFPTHRSVEAEAHFPVPHDPATFARCVLRWTERDLHVSHLRLYQDLLALRREDGVFRRQQSGTLDGAVLGTNAFVLRFASATAEETRLLVINLGVDLVAGSFAEPLIAPPTGEHEWRIRWSSEDTTYGGVGSPEILESDGWRIPGHSATVLAPTRKV